MDISLDLACNPRDYRAIQLNSTAQNRGGLVVIIKRDVKVEKVELIRIAEREEFIKGIVVQDKEGGTMVFWYISPTTTAETFGATIGRLLNEYEVKIMMGDFNARQTAWCSKHDDKKKVAKLIEETKKVPGCRIHAANQPTFQAQRYRGRSSTFVSSNIDLIVAKIKITGMSRMEGRIAEGSDHFPVKFAADRRIEKEANARRVPKTLLQSRQMRVQTGELYKISLKQAADVTATALQRPAEELSDTVIQECYELALVNIREPWEARVRKRRRRSGPHVNAEMLRLWEQKKKAYERWKWHPSERNKVRYKEASRRTQQRERQLIKEQKRRAC